MAETAVQSGRHRLREASSAHRHRRRPRFLVRPSIFPAPGATTAGRRRSMREERCGRDKAISAPLSRDVAASGPVTTISAARSRRSRALSSAKWPKRLRSVPERIVSIKRSARARHLSSPESTASLTRVCAATEFGFGVASSWVECGRSNKIIRIVRGKIIDAGFGVGVVLVERILPHEGLFEITAFAGRFIKR